MDIDTDGLGACPKSSCASTAIAVSRRMVCRARPGSLTGLANERLVNTAGIGDPVSGSIAALALTEWQRRIDVNLTGYVLMAKLAVPWLRALRRDRQYLAHLRRDDRPQH